MSEERGKWTVGEIVEAVGDEIRPTLRGKDAVFGFNLGLEKVRRALGKDSVVFNLDTPGTIEVLETGPLACPDCGAVMVKRRATTEAGEVRVARVCDCDPDTLDAGGSGIDGETLVPSEEGR